MSQKKTLNYCSVIFGPIDDGLGAAFLLLCPTQGAQGELLRNFSEAFGTHLGDWNFRGAKRCAGWMRRNRFGESSDHESENSAQRGDCRKPPGLDGTPWGSDDGRVVEVQAPRMR